MRARYIPIFAVICLLCCWALPHAEWLRPQTAMAQNAATQNTPVRIYNTAKQKLKDGKQLFGATVTLPDPNVYCAMANSGYDFLWIEMQHSPLTYEDVARMIWACRGATAMPFIRVPDATESDKAFRGFWEAKDSG